MWLMLLAAGACGAAWPADAQPPPVTVPATPMLLGANTGVLFNDHRFTGTQIEEQLATLVGTGATTVRSDALWETAEPNPPLLGLFHQYDWRRDDLIAGTLASHGLRWLPIVDYSAAWDESIPGDDHSPPAAMSDYSSYAAALAARYGPGGKFWHDNPSLTPLPVDTYEIWNEPDSRYFWHPTPDPAAYARLYTSTRAAITTVEPTAHVIIGGLTSPASFLASLVRVDPGIQDQISGVAIHPYGRTPEYVLDNVRTTRLAMRSDGLSFVPLYITEFGWTTQPARAPDWAAPGSRPDYIQRTLAGLGRTDCGIAGVLMYAWTTPERDPANSEDWYGIAPPDGSPSRDISAFAAGLHAASSPGPPNPLCSGPSPLASAHQAVGQRNSPRHQRGPEQLAHRFSKPRSRKPAASSR